MCTFCIEAHSQKKRKEPCHASTPTIKTQCCNAIITMSLCNVQESILGIYLQEDLLGHNNYVILLLITEPVIFPLICILTKA